MATSNQERNNLNARGYVYNRQLGKWITPAAIEQHNNNAETAHQIEFWVAIAVVLGILIWFLAMVADRGY